MEENCIRTAKPSWKLVSLVYPVLGLDLEKIEHGIKVRKSSQNFSKLCRQQIQKSFNIAKWWNNPPFSNHYAEMIPVLHKSLKIQARMLVSAGAGSHFQSTNLERIDLRFEAWKPQFFIKIDMGVYRIDHCREICKQV